MSVTEDKVVLSDSQDHLEPKVLPVSQDLLDDQETKVLKDSREHLAFKDQTDRLVLLEASVQLGNLAQLETLET